MTQDRVPSEPPSSTAPGWLSCIFTSFSQFSPKSEQCRESDCFLADASRFSLFFFFPSPVALVTFAFVAWLAYKPGPGRRPLHIQQLGRFRAEFMHFIFKYTSNNTKIRSIHFHLVNSPTEFSGFAPLLYPWRCLVPLAAALNPVKLIDLHTCTGRSVRRMHSIIWNFGQKRNHVTPKRLQTL